jgi:hypothetical protein
MTNGPSLSFKLLTNEDTVLVARPALPLCEMLIRTVLVALISVVDFSSDTRALTVSPSRESPGALERYLTDLEVRSFIVLTMGLAAAVLINNIATTVPSSFINIAHLLHFHWLF